WDVESLSHTIAERRANFTYAPSPLLNEITRSWERHPHRWKSLTTVLHSASKADPQVLAAFAEVSGGRLVEGWGMTENSGGLVTATTPADLTAGTELFDTVGRAVVETGVRVVDAGGTDLAHDGVTVGELLVSSPALADGYWNQPDATAAAFRAGWYHTGDLGTIDPAGYVRIAERRTDLIVSGGMNVYPSEVEQVIGADPRVAACAVVGIPHAQWGQAVAAAVVRASGAGGLDASDVIEVCRAHLASYKKPTAVVFLDALPMTHSMKIARAEVRRLLAAQCG
ncbi:MAG: class I adenylate-forming enzyme family protein, partial [Haloechinothrix sp.]